MTGGFPDDPVMDPHGAWAHLDDRWFPCEVCGLPITALTATTHRRQRVCAGITTHREMFAQGYVVTALSVPELDSVKVKTWSYRVRHFIRSPYTEIQPPHAGIPAWLPLLGAARRHSITGNGAPRATKMVLSMHRDSWWDNIDNSPITVRVRDCDPPRTHTLSVTASGIVLNDHPHVQSDEILGALVTPHACLTARDSATGQFPRLIMAEVERFLAWREAGADAALIDRWMSVSAGPDEAQAWTQAGYAPWEASIATLHMQYPAIHPLADDQIGTAESWRAAGLDVLTARMWGGWTPMAVRPFIDIRVPPHLSARERRSFTPEQAQELLGQGMSLESAVEAGLGQRTGPW